MFKSIFYILSFCIITLTLSCELQAHVKPIISKGPNGSEAHIRDRHWHNSNAVNTSSFKKSIKMTNLFTIASVAINKGKHGVENNGYLSHEYTFKKPIGESQRGTPCKTLRVITDPQRSNGQNAYVVTAFPVK